MGIDLSFFRFTYFEEIALQLFVLQRSLILLLNLTQNLSCVTNARNSQLSTEAFIGFHTDQLYFVTFILNTFFFGRLRHKICLMI